MYFVDSFGNKEGFAPHFGKSQNYGFGNWITLSTLYGLPEDHSVNVVLQDLVPSIYMILGEGSSAMYAGMWFGSLLELDVSSGYWVIMANDATITGSINAD